MALFITDNGLTIQETVGECLRTKLQVINMWVIGNKIENMDLGDNNLQ